MTVAKKERQRKEEAVYIARLQKVQQRLVHSIWEKVQEYCDEQSMPLEGALLLNRGWVTEKVVVTYVDCGGYNSRGVQTYENQGQGFLLERQVRNMWCDLCQKAWNWREEKAKRGEMTRVQYVECKRKDAIGRRVLE